MLVVIRTASIRVSTNHEGEIRNKLKEIYGGAPSARYCESLVGQQTASVACFDNLILRQEQLDRLLDWASEAAFLVSIQY